MNLISLLGIKDAHPFLGKSIVLGWMSWYDGEGNGTQLELSWRLAEPTIFPEFITILEKLDQPALPEMKITRKKSSA